MPAVPDPAGDGRSGVRLGLLGVAQQRVPGSTLQDRLPDGDVGVFPPPSGELFGAHLVVVVPPVSAGRCTKPSVSTSSQSKRAQLGCPAST